MSELGKRIVALVFELDRLGGAAPQSTQEKQTVYIRWMLGKIEREMSQVLNVAPGAYKASFEIHKQQLSRLIAEIDAWVIAGLEPEHLERVLSMVSSD